MERLTEWNGEQTRHAYYPRCFEEPCYGSGCKIKDCPFETAVCDRLAACEDTGLTPEEVERSKLEIEAGCVKAIARMYGIDINRLRKVAEADRDGRVVVKPCKVGDKLYRVFAGEIFEHRVGSMKYFAIQGRWDIETYPFCPCVESSIGKTVFLTHEEAERALRKIQGKEDADGTIDKS